MDNATIPKEYYLKFSTEKSADDNTAISSKTKSIGTRTREKNRPMTPGLIGGILGSLIGVTGGIIGTWNSIKNTNGPKERAFVVKVSAVLWIGVTLYVLGLILLPQPYNVIGTIPYVIFLTFGIRYINKRQAAIREQEN